MNHIKSLLTLSLIAVCSATSVAQSTQKLTAGKHNEYGLIYSLPVTHVRITVEAEKTVLKAGPFFNYAKKYLGVDKVVVADSVKWTIKNIDIDTYGVPDADNRYLMQFKSGYAPFVILSKEGLPLAINEENVETPLPVKQPVEAEPSRLDNNNYASSLPGELLAGESLSKRAEIAARMIYKIRESRTNYATGEADQMPPDGEAMRLALEHLDQQEADLMALFCGTCTTETDVKTFDYVPTGDVAKEVLFRLSDSQGVVDKSNLGGAPVNLSLTILQRGELPKDEKGEVKKLPKGAVMYRIPGRAEIRLTYEGEVVRSSTIDVAQFGLDFGLDPALFIDKKAPTYVKFYPETGSIKELGVKEVAQ